MVYGVLSRIGKANPSLVITSATMPGEYVAGIAGFAGV